MSKSIKIPFAKPDKIKRAQPKGTVATLCIVCTMFFAMLLTSGCKEKEESSTSIDETFFKSIDDRAEIKDKYEFPDISGMNDWNRPSIIQERIAALQMPDRVYNAENTEKTIEEAVNDLHLLVKCSVERAIYQAKINLYQKM